MAVSHHISIELQSALSSERTEEPINDIPLGDVQKEDILKADTLPSEIKFFKDKELIQALDESIPNKAISQLDLSKDSKVKNKS
jgi:hypothetical protein